MDDETMRARFLRLHANLDAYEAGRFPSEAQLRDAPLAEGWWPGRYPGSEEPNLHALRIIGHPRLGTHRRYCSSPVYYVDPDLRWVRTQGVLVRLGRPHADTREHKLRPRPVRYPLLDRYRDACGYRHPPENLEPTGRIGEDPAWNDLFSWFEANTWDAVDATKVYIAQRWEQPVPDVAVQIDGFVKGRLAEADRRDAALPGDPTDYTYFGGYN